MKTKANTLITIPVFNGEKFIGRSLRSCIAQTVETEVWVIDNYSTDNTAEIVREFERQYPQVKLIQNEQNLGRVGNWNRCLELFEGSEYSYLKMLFVGDVLLPGCIDTVEKIFAREAGLAIVVWPYIFVDSFKGSSRTPRMLEENIRLTKEQMVERGMYPSHFAGAIVCHTFAKFAIEGERFNEAFLGMAEFTNKVPLKGDFYHLNTPLSEFHLDGHSSYPKQFEYLFILEKAFTKALSLERCKDWIETEKYQEIKRDILTQLGQKYAKPYEKRE